MVLRIRFLNVIPSLLSVGLLGRVGCHEFGDRLQVFMNGHDSWELTHVHIVALSIVNLGGKEAVCKAQNVAKAVLSLRNLELSLKGREATSDGPVRKRLLVLRSKASTNLLQHG